MENQEQQSKQLALKARICLRTFTDAETKKDLEYVSVELPDPFGDEDFTDVPIRPKWDNVDVMFKFHAKKALRTNPEIEFPITLRVGTYKSKNKTMVTYPALFGVDPFTGKQIEFRVKGKDKNDKNVVIFNSLARDFLGLSSEDEEAV